MNPRAAGVLVLGLALLAAAVVPNLVPKVVIGSPVAEVISGPPTVGECVLSPVPETTPTSASGIYTATVLTYGPCSGTHFGEVIRVIADGSKDLPGGWIATAISDQCGNAALDYVGIAAAIATQSSESGPTSSHGRTDTPTRGSGDADADGWVPVLHDGGTAGIPTDHQRAAGQHWLACTLVPETTAETPTGYRGQVHNALRTGRVPDGVGLCFDAPVIVWKKEVPCNQPHSYQILAEAWTTTGSSVLALTNSCSTLAGGLTKMTDITSGGRLRPLVTFMTWAGTTGILTSSQPIATNDQQAATCAIQALGGSHLSGSLLGLGNGPVPVGR